MYACNIPGDQKRINNLKSNLNMECLRYVGFAVILLGNKEIYTHKVSLLVTMLVNRWCC